MLTFLVILVALVTIGIWLFPLREHKLNNAMAHEVKIHAQPAKRKIINDQYLILTKNPDLDLKPILDLLDLEITMPLLNWTLVSKKNQKTYKELLLTAPEAEDDRLVIRSLLENPHILAAGHNFVLDSALKPENLSFEREWQLQIPSTRNPGGMDLVNAWNITTGNKEVSVAIIDNFLVKDRFTFAKRFPLCNQRVDFLRPYKELLGFDAEGSLPHGEIMLLALGACTNVNPYSAGMDWHAKFMAVERPSKGHAQSFLSALYASGIDVCKESITPCATSFQYMPTKTADIILLPFSTNAPELLHFCSDMVAAISQKNTIIVAAAGNNQAQANAYFPGATPGILNVGALDRQGKRANFSNWGDRVDILAPGDHINFIYPQGSKGAQGTSIAAAYAAGALALLKSLNKDLHPAAAKYFIEKSARSLSCDDYCQEYLGEIPAIPCPTLCCKQKEQCGRRTLDANAALELSSHSSIDVPILSLDRNFVMFFRAQEASERIIARNIGNKEGHVRAVVYDENLIVKPMEFSLSAKGGDHDEQEILIFFKREPFSRHAAKVEFISYDQEQPITTTDLFLEYLPKK